MQGLGGVVPWWGLCMWDGSAVEEFLGENQGEIKPSAGVKASESLGLKLKSSYGNHAERSRLFLLEARAGFGE